MTIMDKRLTMSDAQALTTTAGSSSTVDLGAMTDCWGSSVNPNVGKGEPLWVHVKVGTDFTSANTSSTLLATIEHSPDDSTFSTLVAGTETIIGDIDSGDELINQPLPATTYRYIRAYYTVGTAVFTAGTVDSWIDLEAST